MCETRTEKCYKCGGKGHIEVFGHYAQGVCFQCNGSGTLTVNVTEARGDLPADIKKKADFILAAHENSFAGLPFNRLSKARNFAHNYVMNRAARDVYGDSVLKAWRKYGEPHFQEAQEEMLADFYKRNPVPGQ